MPRFSRESKGKARGIFSVSLAAEDETQVPVLELPSDVAAKWEESREVGLTSCSFRSFATTLRVNDQDFVRFLKPPPMDADITKRLPSGTRTSPPSYSPFWEDELRGVDARVRALFRLNSFGKTVAEHHGRVISGTVGEDSDAFREAKLLSVLVTRSLEASMSLARMICLLRHENACVALRSYGAEFLEGMRKVVSDDQATLFGEVFCENLEVFAERANQEKDLLQAEADLKKSKAKKSKKQKGFKPWAKTSTASAPPVAASSTPTPKPSSGRSYAKGKRHASGAQASKPPPARALGVASSLVPEGAAALFPSQLATELPHHHQWAAACSFLPGDGKPSLRTSG